MRIAIIGTGYVGLTVGTCLSELGNEVICVDINEEKIENLKRGEIPIFEPGLEPLVLRNKEAGRLSFTTDFDSAVEKSEVIFIAVGTPQKENGEADLSHVENVARGIAIAAKNPKIVVEKSTVPVETGEKIAEILSKNNPHNVEFAVVSNPEFLREGSAVEDFMHPDRIVIGTNSEKAKQVMRQIYEPLQAPMIFTDIKSAEIIKHASNSFLATKISFINAIANICEKTGADVNKVAEGMGMDKRIGKSFLNAGIGYGGSCFPKDVEAFIKIAQKSGYDFKLLREVQNINEQQRRAFVKKIEKVLWNLKGKKIAILGLAFKPNTDDMRFAPSIDIVKALQNEGATIAAHDPAAEHSAKTLFSNVEFCPNPYEAAKGADAVLFLTEWQQFRNIDFDKLKSVMKGKVILDGRNMFEPKQMRQLGFEYHGVGR